MTDKKEKKFSPKMEVADFELEKVIGGIGEGQFMPAQKRSLQPSPELSAQLVKCLKDPPIHVMDSSSEERKH